MDVMSKTPSLFDFMDIVEAELKTEQNIVVVDEKKLKSILESMKQWINDGTLVKSDFYDVLMGCVLKQIYKGGKQCRYLKLV